MGINLSKGGSINLSKEKKQPKMDILNFGLGWDMVKSGIFGTGPSYDLDASALLLVNGKLLSNDDVVYYGHKLHKSGSVKSNGDNLTGSGDGDDEVITVNTTKLDPKYTSILLFVTVYQGKSKNQSFGNVKNAFIRAFEEGGNEIAKYQISSDPALKDKCTFVFGELCRIGEEWEFRAVGESYSEDSIQEFVKRKM